MIDPVRCLRGVFEDDARYFAWCLVFLLKTEEDKIWMFFTFKVFLWLCGRNREIIYFFLSGLWRVFTLTCCSRLPVAVCVNGFFLWGGRRRGDLMMACDASFRAASFIWCVHPPRSHGTRKKSWSWETRTVSVRQVSFFFETIFSVKNFIALKLIFDFLFLFFFTAWFWGTGHEQRRCTQPPIQSRR